MSMRKRLGNYPFFKIFSLIKLSGNAKRSNQIFIKFQYNFFNGILELKHQTFKAKSQIW